MQPDVTLLVDNTTTSTLIGGLSSGTRYIVNVSAFNSAGGGIDTSLSVTTYKGKMSLVKRKVNTASAILVFVRTKTNMNDSNQL